jgi:hypothetical protein
MKVIRPSNSFLEAVIVTDMIVLTLVLPIAIYGVLSWHRFDYFSLSYYIPYEAMRAELAKPTLAKIVYLPLVEMNMTSGNMLANMYTLTLGQLVLSITLGLVMGLVLAGQLRLHGLCELRGRQNVSAAAGASAGLLATIAAASTGLLGCCGGSAFSGGIFALAGLSSAAAATLAKASPFIQIGLILLFAALYVRLRRRRAAIGHVIEPRMRN